MSDTVAQPLKTTEEILSDFFFLLFIPNPQRNMVRIIVDDGSIKLFTNTQKFIEIIRSTMGNQAATKVKCCCDTYGCYYVIDRCENAISKLDVNSEEGIIRLKDLHEDILRAKESGEVDDAARTKYFETLNGFTKPELSRGSKSINNSQNHFNATIIYGQNIQRGYRPY